MPITVSIDHSELSALHHRVLERAVTRAARRAGSTALRDMRSEASKRIRRRKRLKVRAVKKAVHIRKPRGRVSLDNLEWQINIDGKPVPLAAYPHRQTRRGVSVTVNRGKRTVIKSAFVARLASGHNGVLLRRGAARLPIRELLGSRPVDALLHNGEAAGVATRGARSFRSTIGRLLKAELRKSL